MAVAVRIGPHELCLFIFVVSSYEDKGMFDAAHMLLTCVSSSSVSALSVWVESSWFSPLLVRPALAALYAYSYRTSLSGRSFARKAVVGVNVAPSIKASSSIQQILYELDVFQVNRKLCQEWQVARLSNIFHQQLDI